MCGSAPWGTVVQEAQDIQELSAGGRNKLGFIYLAELLEGKGPSAQLTAAYPLLAQCLGVNVK